MPLATLGDLTFVASEDEVLTWTTASRSGKARWADLDVHLAKPKREFQGPGRDTISLSIRLDIDRGVVPRDVLRSLRDLRDAGEVLQFAVGGELVGDYSIDSVNEDWRRVDADGVLVTAQVAIVLEEYA